MKIRNEHLNDARCILNIVDVNEYIKSNPKRIKEIPIHYFELEIGQTTLPFFHIELHQTKLDNYVVLK